MNPYDLEKGYKNVIEKFIKVGIDQQEAKQVVDGLLQQPWVQNLMVFSNQALLVIDAKTGKYCYLSPTIENIVGYKAEEFPDIYSIAKILTPGEMVLIPRGTEIAFTKIASLNYSPEALKKLRYSRNNWFIRKDGTPVNLLQQSMGLAFNEQGIVLLEFVLITDITHFNSSPHHFYTIAEVKEDGTSNVLFHGVLEQDHVTSREQEVYSLLTQGKTSEEIASTLSISPETVKAYRKNLLEKTGTDNSIDLLRYGFANGWM